MQFLVEHGNAVTLSYRRDQFWRMNDQNREKLLSLERAGRVEILRKSHIVRVEDSNGRPEVHFAEPEFGVRTYDDIVYALGGTTPKNFLRYLGIAFEGEQPQLRNGVETNIPGLFLVGDLVAGWKGGSIIAAFNSSCRAMAQICSQYLACEIQPY